DGCSSEIEPQKTQEKQKISKRTSLFFWVLCGRLPLDQNLEMGGDALGEEQAFQCQPMLKRLRRLIFNTRCKPGCTLEKTKVHQILVLPLEQLRLEPVLSSVLDQRTEIDARGYILLSHPLERLIIHGVPVEATKRAVHSIRRVETLRSVSIIDYDEPSSLEAPGDALHPFGKSETDLSPLSLLQPHSGSCPVVRESPAREIAFNEIPPIPDIELVQPSIAHRYKVHRQCVEEFVSKDPSVDAEA